MSDKPAGWYPDPDGQNRQRYWDGDAWSEYYTPLASQQPEIHGASTAAADYPYLAASRGAGAHHDLMATPGTAGTGTRGGGWPTSGAAAANDGGTLEFSGGGSRPSSASRWAVIAASILVVGLVLGVGWWALFGRGGSGEPNGPSTTSGAPPTDGATSTGTLELGKLTRGNIAEGGAWVGTLTLDADTVLVLDARADSSDQDLLISVAATGGGSALATNDDRGSYLEPLGGNALDPLVATTLPAGSYDVTVTEREGRAATVALSVTPITETLTPGGSATGSIPGDGAWFAVLDIAADGSYQVEVTSDGDTDTGATADPVLVLIGPDGDQLVSDDRAQDQYDPLLVQDLTAGTWVVVVTEFNGGGAGITVTASAS